MSDLRIKAGKRAYDQIRDGGFSLDAVSAYFGPAVGPRWLVASGFDLTLMREGVLGRRRPVLLVGASAGAWRFAAWMQPEPEKSYRSLMAQYTETIYTRDDTPETVLAKLARIMDSYLEDDALLFALDNKRYRLAIITARGKGLVGSPVHTLQKIGLGMCFCANALRRSLLFSFADRIVFYSGAKPPLFCLRQDFLGEYVPLDEVNFKSAVLASGAIPLVVAGVRDIYGAPRGVYRDGGLIDYHLTADYGTGGDDVVLFFHHQERIIPGWLDKRFPARRPPPEILENVLMAMPSPNFIARLPLGKVPDRDDYVTFMDRHAERIAHWRAATELSARLGEEFLELLASGRIRDRLEPL